MPVVDEYSCGKCKHFIEAEYSWWLYFARRDCPKCDCWEDEYGCCANRIMNNIGVCDIDNSIVGDCFNYFGECGDYEKRSNNEKL